MDYHKKFSKDLWTRENKTNHHSNRIFNVVSHHAKSPSGKIENSFYILETKDWVNVIPITSQGEVVMVHQYRHGIHSYSLEFPGGIVEKTGNDRYLQTAQDELMEETGYSSGSWTLLGKMSGNPAFLNNWNYSFLAENVEQTGKQKLDENEEIDIVLVPLPQIPELIHSGVIHHSMMIAIAGLFFSKNEYRDLWK